MFRPYAEVLRVPGARAFSASALVARMPISMLGLGIMMAVEAGTGAYGPAGLVSGAALVGQAVAAPFQARLADRLGQTRMIVPFLTAHLTALGVLVALVGRTTTGELAVVAFLAGATLPQIGPLVRARWAFVLGGGDGLQTAFALESVIDEFVFLIGWPLVTVLATAVHPNAGLAGCLVLTVAGCVALAVQRGTDPGPRMAPSDAGSEPFPVGVLARLVLAFLLMGAVFGSIQVTTAAFAGQAGQSGATGLILAIHALGSMVAGLATGAIRWQIDPLPRFGAGQVALAVAALPLPMVTSTPVLGVALFVTALTIAPTLAAGFSALEAGVPARRLTECLGWLLTALITGRAVGFAAAGSMIDRTSTSASFLLPALFAALAAFACMVRFRRPARESAA